MNKCDLIKKLQRKLLLEERKNQKKVMKNKKSQNLMRRNKKMEKVKMVKMFKNQLRKLQNLKLEESSSTYHFLRKILLSETQLKSSKLSKKLRMKFLTSKKKM